MGGETGRLGPREEDARKLQPVQAMPPYHGGGLEVGGAGAGSLPPPRLLVLAPPRFHAASSLRARHPPAEQHTRTQIAEELKREGRVAA